MFRARDVEVAVLEVGLGGRLDAANIIDADVAVVCSIGMDHATGWAARSRRSGARRPAFSAPGGRRCSASADLPPSVAADRGRGRGASPSRRTRLSRAASTRGLGLRTRRHPAARICAPAAARQAPDRQCRRRARRARRGGFGGRLTPARRGAGVARDAPRRAVPDRARDRSNGFWTSRTTCPRREGLRANLRARPRAARTIAVCGILGDKDILGITATLRDEFDVWIPAALDGPRAVSAHELAARLPADADVHAQTIDVPRGVSRRARARETRRSRRRLRIVPHGGSGARLPWAIVAPWIRARNNASPEP